MTDTSGIGGGVVGVDGVIGGIRGLEARAVVEGTIEVLESGVTSVPVAVAGSVTAGTTEGVAAEGSKWTRAEDPSITWPNADNKVVSIAGVVDVTGAVVSTAGVPEVTVVGISGADVSGVATGGLARSCTVVTSVD